MQTARVLGLLCLLTVLAPREARADGWYFLEGFGAARAHGDLAQVFEPEPAFTVNLAAGRRIGNFGVQAFLSAVTMLQGAGEFSGGRYEAVSYGLDARYIVPVAGPLGVYVRGGLDKMRVAEMATGPANAELDDLRYRGRGLHYGAGIRVSGKVRALGLLYWPMFFFKVGPKITGSLWLDASRQRVRLHERGRPTLDGQVTAWSFGFAVGSDF